MIKTLQRIPFKNHHFLQLIQQSFSTSSNVKMVRNNNLQFESSNYTVKLYTFYPELTKISGQNKYVIPSASNVASIIFLKKDTEFKKAWDQRQSFAFQFKSLGYLLDVEPMSRKKAFFQSFMQGQKNPTKTILFQDKPQTESVQITFKKLSLQNSSLSLGLQEVKNQQLKTEMPYSQYLTFQNLLQKSLVHLSGWQFLLELQKRKQLKALKNGFNNLKQYQDLSKNS